MMKRMNNTGPGMYTNGIMQRGEAAMYPTPRAAYMDLARIIYGYREVQSNPIVYVIDFELVK